MQSGEGIVKAYIRGMEASLEAGVKLWGPELKLQEWGQGGDRLEAYKKKIGRTT